MRHFDADLHGLRGIDLHILHHELAFRFPRHGGCTTQNRHNPCNIVSVFATNNDSQLQGTLSQTHHFKHRRRKKDDNSTHWERIRSKPHPPHIISNNNHEVLFHQVRFRTSLLAARCSTPPYVHVEYRRRRLTALQYTHVHRFWTKMVVVWNNLYFYP